MNEESTLKRSKSSQPQRAEISPPNETTVKEANFPVKDTPELEHANSPVKDTPELEDANSPVNDAPELEDANFPVKDTPELEDANSPVKDAPELEHANFPVSDVPELEDVILTDETSQPAESTTPKRLISFSLTPMPMTVPGVVVSTQSILKHSSPVEKPSALKVKLSQIKMIPGSWFQKRKCSKHHRRIQSRTTLTMSILTLCYVINWLPHLIARFAFLNDCLLLLLVCRHHHRHRRYQQHQLSS